MSSEQLTALQAACQYTYRASHNNHYMISVAVALASILPKDHPLLAMPMLPNVQWNTLLLRYISHVSSSK
jgi:hypothetical protein